MSGMIKTRSVLSDPDMVLAVVVIVLAVVQTIATIAFWGAAAVVLYVGFTASWGAAVGPLVVLGVAFVVHFFAALGKKVAARMMTPLPGRL